jgi:hypothetical protein
MAIQVQTLHELAQERADNRELLYAIVATQGTALGRKNFTAGAVEGLAVYYHLPGVRKMEAPKLGPINQAGKLPTECLTCKSTKDLSQICVNRGQEMLYENFR